MRKIRSFLKFLFYAAVFILLPQTGCSQNDSVSIENLGIETDNADIQDRLTDWINTKIKINSNDKMELMKTPFLNIDQINAIINHIQTYGYITNPYELQQISELNTEEIQIILPHLDFGLEIKIQIHQIFKQEKLKHKILIQEIVRTELSKGYGNNVEPELQFKGSPFASKFRLESTFGQYLNLTVSANKDPGEKMENGQIGVSCVLQLNSRLKQIILGDFQASFGQGTILGSGINIGKSAAVINTMRAGSRIRPFRSNSAAAHMNGIALKFDYSPHLKNWIFFSNTTALTDTIQNNDLILLRSDNTNGLRRNEKELKSIKRSKSIQTGTYLEWSKRNTGIAFGCLLNKINSEIVYPSKPSKYPFFNKYDSTLIPISIDVKTNIGNGLIFAELGTSHLNSGKCIIVGVLNAIDQRTDVSILFRKFDKDFRNPLSGAFSESSKKSAETGLYIGLIKKTGKSTKINAYFDWFNFQQPGYNIDWPSSGLECLSEFTYSKKNGPEIKLRIGFKNGSENEKGNQALNRMDQIQSNSFRLDFVIPMSKTFSIHSRAETKHIRSLLGNSQTGYLLYHQINGAITRHIKFKVRGMVFNSPQYDSRIFVYENDISNSFSIKAYQNIGSHFYILLQTKLQKNIQIKLRFAHTKFHNLNIIGSGIDQIHSNKLNEIKIELGTSI